MRDLPAIVNSSNMSGSVVAPTSTVNMVASIVVKAGSQLLKNFISTKSDERIQKNSVLTHESEETKRVGIVENEKVNVKIVDEFGETGRKFLEEAGKTTRAISQDKTNVRIKELDNKKELNSQFISMVKEDKDTSLKEKAEIIDNYLDKETKRENERLNAKGKLVGNVVAYLVAVSGCVSAGASYLIKNN